MAKTQMSLSMTLRSRDVLVASGNRSEVRLSAGAGFVVPICGSIMTMPGLPKKPAAEAIDVDDQGLTTACSRAVKKRGSGMYLTDEEKRILDGGSGPGTRKRWNCSNHWGKPLMQKS